MVISHGHYDHAGGFRIFQERECSSDWIRSIPEKDTQEPIGMKY
ncbi:hypothetical protein [Thermotoga sp. Mc24]|nr:hypothetical protein [Thermotoga sp. Mc24]